MFMVGVSAGCAVFFAQFWGTRDVKNIRRVLGVGLGSAVIVATFFMVAGFLSPRRIIMLFTHEPQVIKDGARYLQIVLISYLFTAVTLIYSYAFRSIGNSVQQMVISAVALLCNTFFNYVLIFGKFGAPAMGVAGAAVMIGNSIGAGDIKLTREYARRFSYLGVIAGLILGLLLAAGAPYLLNIFNVSSAVRNYTQIIIYTVAVIFFIRVYNILQIVGVLRGGGDAQSAFILEGFTMWFIGVPLTVLGAFVFKLPIHLVYGLSLFEEIAKALLCLWRYRSGRWIRNVTHRFGSG